MNREIDSQINIGRTIESLDEGLDEFKSSSKDQTTFEGYVAKNVDKNSDPVVPELEID